MTDQELLDALKDFAALVVRMGETGEASMFTNPSHGGPAMGSEHINAQFMLTGRFGAAERFFDAIRELKKRAALTSQEPRP